MKLFRIFLKIFLAAALISSCSPKDRYITITGHAQGGTYAVKLNLNGNDGMIQTPPEEIRDSIDAILQKIDNTLSGYNKNSLLSRLNAGETVEWNDMMSEIFGHAARIQAETKGAVDVAAGPLFDLWGFGFESGDFPSDEEVRKTKETSNLEYYILHEEGILNFNAIAQGYSCDLVAEYLYSLGVKDMMVDIGEIFCDGRNPSGLPWSLGIDKPVDGNNQLGAQIQGVTPIEPRVLLHALQLADGYVVAEVQGMDGGVEFLPQDAHKGGEEDVPDALCTQRKHLRHNDIFESVHRQAGEAVGFSEDETAALEVGLSHDGAAVGHGVAQAALPEQGIKAVVGVAGQDADADLGVAVVKARAEVLVLIGVNVHETAVGGGGGEARNLIGVDPRMTALQSLLALGGDGGAGISAFFHGKGVLSVVVDRLREGAAAATRSIAQNGKKCKSSVK